MKDFMGFGSYETTWTWLNKLRRAIVRTGREKLTGIVEVDEAYIGGEESGHNAHLKSLHQFMTGSNHHLAIQIWTESFSIDEVKAFTGKSFRLINLPFYMISRLPDFIQAVKPN